MIRLIDFGVKLLVADIMFLLTSLVKFVCKKLGRNEGVTSAELLNAGTDLKRLLPHT